MTSLVALPKMLYEELLKGNTITALTMKALKDFVQPLACKLAKEAATSILKSVADDSVGKVMKGAMVALGEALGVKAEGAKERNIGVVMKVNALSPDDPDIKVGGWTFTLSAYFRSEVGFTFAVAIPETLAIFGEMWRGTEIDVLRSFLCNDLFVKASQSSTTAAGQGLATTCNQPVL